MYCPSCGIEVTQELNYCNRCGANLNPSANIVPYAPLPPVKLTGPTIALGAMVVISMAIIFGAAESLVLRGMHPGALALMVIVGLATLFGVAGLVIRLWTSLLAHSQSRSADYQPPQMKRGHPTPQLQSPPTGPMNPPVGSVTDHTTRTFDPAYREKTERRK